MCCAWLCGASGLWADDVGRSGWSQERRAAVLEWNEARENLEEARAESAAARRRLDAFLSEHFQEQLERPAPAANPYYAEARPDPELARLKTRLQELGEHRDELLGYLTEEHPQVIDVDRRIALAEERMAGLSGASAEAGQPAEPAASLEARWSEYANGLTRQAAEDLVAYQKLFDAWQETERAVDAARLAEDAAFWRLDAIATATFDESAAQRGAGGEAEGQRDAAGGRRTAESSSAGSQPLALGALLIALAVAAVAALSLARSTADPVFASVDEVAAALAIPVVGIIPATAARLQKAGSSGTPRRATMVLLWQILVAVLVFAVVAYAVQNPGDLWRLCTRPLEALGLMSGS